MFYDPFDDDRDTEFFDPDEQEYPYEVTIEDNFGDLRSYSMNDWHEILLMEDEDVRYFFGMSHFDIINELYMQGYWDDLDWERWRDAYASVHGV